MADVDAPEGFLELWKDIEVEGHLGADVLGHFAKQHNPEEYERVCRFHFIPTSGVQEHHVKHYILAMLGDDVVCYRKLRDGVSAHWRRDGTTGVSRWILDEKRASIDSQIDEDIVVPLLGHVKIAADEAAAQMERQMEEEGITTRRGAP